MWVLVLCYHSSSSAEDGEERGPRDTVEDGGGEDLEILLRMGGVG